MVISEDVRLEEEVKALKEQLNAKEQEIQLLKNEKLFSEKVLDSLPGIFYLYDAEGNIVRWNKNHETLTGFTKEELHLRNAMDWFEGEHKERITEKIKEILQTGQKTEVEAELLIKGDQKVPYYFTGLKVELDNEPFLLGVGIDLSKLKKAEQALKKSEEKYRTIFENIVEGIFQITPEGKLINANPALFQILEYDSLSAMEKEIPNFLFDPFVSHTESARFLKKLCKKNMVSDFEAEFYRKDKGTIWVSLHAREVYDEDGNLSMIEGMLTDITEIKKKNDALKDRQKALIKENSRLKTEFKDRYRFGNIIGKSLAMQHVYELILKAADSSGNVIIYGESGTGKELTAGAIHELSDRKSNRFVPVNCGAIPENLLESEFFGYKKGAFTNAIGDKAGYLDQADRGTLFLDELGELDVNLQVKLLRVLEGNGFTPVGGNHIKNPSVRIIAATNKNLQDLVAAGDMREDFFYRIHIIPIKLPPLRERKEDIPLLVEHFIKKEGKGKKHPPITGKIIDAMMHYDWPGNVRELHNVLHRYLILNQFDLFKPQLEKETAAPGTLTDIAFDSNGIQYKEAMNTFEKKMIEGALQNNNWQRIVTADKLGLPLRTFYRKLEKHGLIQKQMSKMA